MKVFSKSIPAKMRSEIFGLKIGSGWVFVSRFVARGQNCGNVRIRRMTHFLKQSLVLLKHVCASTICATIKLEQPLQMENH